MMIIGYSTSPYLTTEERLRSLRDSVQRALEETADLESVEKISKTELPQLEKRIEHLENGVDVTVKEILSEPVSTTSSSSVATATAEIEEINGYTPYAVSAYMAIAGSGYTFCNIYNVRVDDDEAKCDIKYLGTSTATDVKVKFKVIYIANKMLTAGTATASSGGTHDYTALINKPSIEGVTLQGDKTFEELTLVSLDNTDTASAIRNTV